MDVGERGWNRTLALLKDHSHLKPNDALEAAALDAGIGAIVSTDEDFDGLQRLRRQDFAKE